MRRVIALVVLSTATLSAHHSFGVAFDATKTVMLSGVITKVAWTIRTPMSGWT